MVLTFRILQVCTGCHGNHSSHDNHCKTSSCGNPRGVLHYNCLYGEAPDLEGGTTGRPHNLCVKPMLFYSKCTGFTVFFTYSNI